MGLRLYYCDHMRFPFRRAISFRCELRPGARESPADRRFELTEAPMADPGDIELAHDPRM